MVITEIKKRNGSTESYDAQKIINAIQKANKEVSENEQVSLEQIEKIISDLEAQRSKVISIEEIQDFIEDELIKIDKAQLAKRYIIYRYQRELIRKANTTDESILSLIENQNKEVGEENSNKDSTIASTQRDLVAGEVSKDLSRRILLPEHIKEAHDNGTIHFHDMDYFMQPMFNCCLINIKDMLENGTVMNKKMIESPKSFQVACTVTTQIIAAVASSQYGGQSVNIKHLGKYLKYTKDKYARKYQEQFWEELTQEQINKLVETRIKDELSSGVQTIQYQINTLMTTNGQSPFVTLFLELDPNDEYIEETAMIIQEILEQRIKGIKNEAGIYVTPAFPKLIYVLDEHNALKGGKYDYLTKIAAKCSAKRMYPDYISAKKMRENYEGNVFSPMGCRSFLNVYKDEQWKYKFEWRFNQGVVTLNLPQIAIDAKDNEEKFWKLFDERLDLVFEALMCRHKRLKWTTSDMSPIHRQYGAIARLKPGEKIDKYLFDDYSTISLGYIGIYETTYLMKKVSHTDPEGTKFALAIMNKLRDTTQKRRKETNIGFGLYGTPAESLCYRLASIDKERYGDIENVTDKGYYTNSYHVDVREEINAFDKLTFESQFHSISSSGAISYVEIPNMQKNIEALETMITYIYDNIQYAEFNTKSDYCMECGFDQEIIINDNNERECPNCHNTDKRKMSVTRRTCWYLWENYWNQGKTKEIKKRVLHCH